MEPIINFFEGNPMLNFISFLIGVIGIILAFIFYYKSLREKKPTFNMITFGLIDNKLSTINNLEIKYNANLVKNLSLTKVAFWNSGKESIRKSDIATNDQLRIVAKNVIIYGFEIIIYSEVNEIITTLINEELINISFEFLNQNDGIVLNIYHSGNKNEDLKLEGTFIGSKKLSEPIKQEFLLAKVNQLNDPAQKMMDNKYFIIRFFGLLLIIVILPIFISLTFFGAFFDVIYYKLSNKTPHDFDFYKE